MNRDMVKGMALGLGVGLLTPVMMPFLARTFRPTLHAAIRSGVLAWERGRETLAELGEYAEDAVAEARAGAHDGPMGHGAMPAGDGEASIG